MAPLPTYPLFHHSENNGGGGGGDSLLAYLLANFLLLGINHI
jgi:hypothetical protein